MASFWESLVNHCIDNCSLCIQLKDKDRIHAEDTSIKSGLSNKDQENCIIKNNGKAYSKQESASCLRGRNGLWWAALNHQYEKCVTCNAINKCDRKRISPKLLFWKKERPSTTKQTRKSSPSSQNESISKHNTEGPIQNFSDKSCESNTNSHTDKISFDILENFMEIGVEEVLQTQTGETSDKQRNNSSLSMQSEGSSAASQVEGSNPEEQSLIKDAKDLIPDSDFGFDNELSGAFNEDILLSLESDSEMTDNYTLDSASVSSNNDSIMNESADKPLKTETSMEDKTRFSDKDGDKTSSSAINMLEFSEDIEKGAKEIVENSNNTVKMLDFAEDTEENAEKHASDKPMTIFKAYECERCKWIFSSSAELTQHISLCGLEYPTSCSYCNKPVPNEGVMKLHIDYHRKEGMKGTKVCENCQESFMNYGNLMAHIKINPKCRDAPNLCKYCGKKLPSDTDFSAHVQNHRETTHPFKCDRCDDLFVTKKSLCRHITDGHLSQNFCCEACGKVFKAKQHLVRHMKSHREREHECHECGRKFVLLSHLKTHMKIHFR